MNALELPEPGRFDRVVVGWTGELRFFIRCHRAPADTVAAQRVHIKTIADLQVTLAAFELVLPNSFLFYLCALCTNDEAELRRLADELAPCIER